MAIIQVSTPQTVVQCELTVFEWYGGEPPYYLDLWSDNSSHVLLRAFAPNTTSFVWLVDLSAGTKFNIAVADNSGISQPQNVALDITVGPSDDDSCVVNNGNVEESITSTGSIIASSSTAFTTASVHSDKKVDRRVVAGATVGGLAIVIAALLAIIILRRRTRRRHNSEELSIDAFAEITPHVSLHSDNRAKGGGESVTNEALTGIREHVGVGERDITEPDLEASNLSPTPVIAVNDDFIRMSTNSEASELVALRRRVYILEAERRLLPPPSYVSMNDS